MTIRRSLTRSGSAYGAVAVPAAPGDDGTTTDDDGINDDDEASPQADMSPNPRGNGQSGREEAPCGEDPPRRHAAEVDASDAALLEDLAKRRRDIEDSRALKPN